jgi:hypothetical protein
MSSFWHTFAVALALSGATPALADCTPTDFMTLSLPMTDDPIGTALALAYPRTTLDHASATLTFPDGATVAFAPARDLTGGAALENATIGDQFAQVYPLEFDVTQRETPWFDPGRARNESLFRALWFDSEAAARATLTIVTYPPTGENFQMTTRHCVATQLAAAFADLQASGNTHDVWFTATGGSFNWRVIAGTDRLSAHSFGTAIDLNADLGGYWRWSGATEGAVGPIDTTMPPAIVATMERFGFIWGGKWHHFDGMHFEYRPELILYARLVGG